MNRKESKSVTNATRVGPGEYASRVKQLLADSPLTELCARETRDEIQRMGRIDKYCDQTSLHHAGGVVNDLTLVVDGSLVVSRIGAQGKRHVVAFLAPGQFFGLVALLDGKECIHDTRAQGPLTVLRIPKTVVMGCLDRDPAFRDAVLGLLCERSRAIYGVLMDHTLLPLRSRTARAIQTLASTWGSIHGEHVVITLKISQDGLADMLGVTRQSTNRELKRLERDGVIRLGNSELEVLSFSALCRVADGHDIQALNP